jgi:signal transduction histidine kinase
MLRKSFSAKLTLGILLLAVPIFVISLGVLFFHARQMILREAVGHANSVLSATMQHVRRNLLAIETATNANMWLVEGSFQPDSLQAYSRRIVELNPHIDGCSISAEPYTFPEHGRHFSVYTIRQNDYVKSVIEADYDYQSKIWYKTPYEKEAPCWIAYFDEGDSLEITLDGMVATYARPIYRADSTIIGIISTDLSLLRFSKVISEERPYPNSYFMMVDQEGRFFIHPDSTHLFNQTIFTNVSPHEQSDVIVLGHEMTQGKSGSINVVIDGAPCVVCYQPVPGTSWSFALVCPETDILKDYYQLTNIVVALLMLGLAVIILLTYRTVSHIIRPVNELLVTTYSISKGNRQLVIPETDRMDVIGLLQNSFARMLQSLRYHIDNVRSASDQARKRNEELTQAMRLAEEADRQKTAFIQNVYHQVRTPLNIVMGFAEVLGNTASESEKMPEEEMKSIMDMMSHDSTILCRILLMLYDSSDTALANELHCNKHDKTSCNEVAREAIAYVKGFHPELDFYMETEVPDDLCITTNHRYILLSLREILYNSTKYSDKQHIGIRVTRTDKTVRFILQNTGEPIPEKEQETIFKFFAKADDLSEGLGLGLPLTKHHIQNLGGELTLDTDYKDGCRFIVEMPLDQKENTSVNERT